MPTEALTKMATIKVETTVRRRLAGDGPSSQHSTEDVSCMQERDVTLTREVDNVEDVMWALEAKDHAIVKDLWDEKMGEFWEDWGWYGYPRGDVTVELESGSGKYTPHPEDAPDHFVTVHQVAEHIAQRDDVDDKAGVYLELIEGTPRLGSGHRALYTYLAAERGVDTSYYLHGKKVRD